MFRGRIAVMAVLLAGMLAWVCAGAAHAVIGADWAVDSDQIGAAFGENVAVVGDVNGDGYSDVVVGAPLYDSFGTDGGRAFLFLGSAAGFPAAPTWSVVGGQNGAHLGDAVAGAGDVNGDGYDDVLIAAPDYDDGEVDEGQVRLYLGSPAGLGGPVWTAEGNQAHCSFGVAIAGLGDVNGDGYDDIAIGAPHYDNGQADEGRVSIYYGSAMGLPESPSTTREPNVANSFFGVAVASAGDVNADGLDDAIVGAYGMGEDGEGAAYVYLGTIFGLAQSTVWVSPGTQAGAHYGGSVAGVGDVNGDGYGDVVVGAFLYDHFASIDAGAAFLYYGSSAGVEETVAWDYAIQQHGANLGQCVAPAGDVNGDGYADIAIGAPSYTYNYMNEGLAAVFHGSPTGPGIGPERFWKGGQEYCFLGNSLGAAGDVDGDGYGELIAGAYSYDDGHADEGEVFVFRGSAGDLPPMAAWRSMGPLSQTEWGSALAFGDFDGDGFDDVAAGAPLTDSGVDNQGLVFVSYGRPGAPEDVFDWAKVGGVQGYRLGWAVAAADVNGDGFDDLLAGAPCMPGGPTPGRVFVYHGSADGLPEAADLEIVGSVASFGKSVINAGDLDGDGYLDVVIGSPAELSGNGRIHMYKGSENGLSTTPDWTYSGAPSWGNLGEALAGGGDVNGDGYADFAAAAPELGGKVAVFFGGESGLGISPDWLSAGPSQDSDFGRSMAFGDLDGDGDSDLVVGAPGHEHTLLMEGAAYVFFAANGGLPALPAWAQNGGMQQAEFGSKVGAADVDNDGLCDLIVSAPGYSSGENMEGKVYLFRAPVATGDPPVWTIESNHWGAFLGEGMAAGGDVNGDGFADVVVGAPLLHNDIDGLGEISLYLGGEGGGVLRGIRQTRQDGSTRVALGAGSFGTFQMSMDLRSPFGRGKMRVEYEVQRGGQAFDGSGIARTDWLDAGAPVPGQGIMLHWSEIASVAGLTPGDPVQWRARVVTDSPWFPASPWFSPSGNGETEWDLRIGEGQSAGVEPSDGSAGGFGSSPRLSLAGGNPFHSTAMLEYALPSDVTARVAIYDVAGREVAVLAEGPHAAGTYRVSWDGRVERGSDAASGVYFARLETMGNRKAMTLRVVRER